MICMTIVLVFIFSCAATYLVREWARAFGLMDSPSARSSHTVPTPRGGGAAIVLAFSVGIGVLCRSNVLDTRVSLVLLGSGWAVASIGLTDDITNVAPHFRLLVQVLSAVAAVWFLGSAQSELDFSGRYELAPWFAFAVLSIVWATNLFNFMDGIDGIAASEAVFLAASGAFLYWQSGGGLGLTTALLCLGAAAAGFLLWNWSPASIFMGDVGSGFLGFVLALFAMETSQQKPSMMGAWPILGGVFVVDATVTLVTRMLRRDPWLQPHRTHAYQHLAQRLRGHNFVLLVVTAINLCWLFPWAWLTVNVAGNSGLYVGIALAPLVLIAVMLRAGKPAKS